MTKTSQNERFHSEPSVGVWNIRSRRIKKVRRERERVMKETVKEFFDIKASTLFSLSL